MNSKLNHLVKLSSLNLISYTICFLSILSCGDNTSITDHEKNTTKDQYIYSFVLDESDLEIPKKRKKNFKTDKDKEELRGPVRKVIERHYMADNNNDVLHIEYDSLLELFSWDSGHGTRLSPIAGNNGLLEAQQDKYYDYDGFQVKTVRYKVNKQVDRVTYTIRDEDGNLVKLMEETEKGKNKTAKINMVLDPYVKSHFDPENKELATNYGTSRSVSKVDEHNNVVLEQSYDNINSPSRLIYSNKYIYQYDNYGNWTQRTTATLDMNTNKYIVIGVTERSISYWE